ncbi:MAG: hypothetical protein ILO36_01395 [Abditibacteriota bacterium]|nr:hypothetical protein [Abditibacteriota bacterium]
MQKLNNPKMAIVLAIVAVVLIVASIKITNKVTHKAERDSIYLNEEDKKIMIEAFKDGSAYATGAGTAPAPSADPAPESSAP